MKIIFILTLMLSLTGLANGEENDCPYQTHSEGFVRMLNENLNLAITRISSVTERTNAMGEMPLGRKCFELGQAVWGLDRVGTHLNQAEVYCKMDVKKYSLQKTSIREAIFSLQGGVFDYCENIENFGYTPRVTPGDNVQLKSLLNKVVADLETVRF